MHPLICLCVHLVPYTSILYVICPLIHLCVHLDDSDVDSTDYSSEEDRPVQVSHRYQYILLSLFIL